MIFALGCFRRAAGTGAPGPSSRRLAQRLAQPLLPLVRKRRLEHAAFVLRHPRQDLVGRDLLHQRKGRIVGDLRRNRADEFGLIVRPRSLMKSSGMPKSLSLPASAPLAAPIPAPTAMPASGLRNSSPIRLPQRAPEAPPASAPVLASGIAWWSWISPSGGRTTTQASLSSIRYSFCNAVSSVSARSAVVGSSKATQIRSAMTSLLGFSSLGPAPAERHIAHRSRLRHPDGCALRSRCHCSNNRRSSISRSTSNSWSARWRSKSSWRCMAAS